jgi:hypothetical protein
MAAKRKRPYVIAVQVNDQELQELRRAATRRGLALSVFVRTAALTTIRDVRAA